MRQKIGDSSHGNGTPPASDPSRGDGDRRRGSALLVATNIGKTSSAGWVWTPQGLEPVGQHGGPQGIEIQYTETTVLKARPTRPVGATLDSALARQARAKKNLALVEVQLAAAQQKMEEAKTEMAAADGSVRRARQLAVQDKSIVADAEVPAQALRLPPQQQGLVANAPKPLRGLTEALTSMRARQKEKQRAAPTTPTVTQGSEPFKMVQSHRKQSCGSRNHWRAGKLEDPSGTAKEPHDRGADGGTGERRRREEERDGRGTAEVPY